MFADVNTQVESGAKLLRIEPAADQAAEPGVHGVRADLGALADAAAGDGDPAETAADALVALRSLVLGYDAEAARNPQEYMHAYPLVILANLSGFDGSPESLRQLQLEYGAEIARAMVNFDGPIVFCVVSRYHGGAFVVSSGTLNDNMEVAAVEGSRASVIGGAPAAAVVFAAEVRKRTAADPRVAELQAAIAGATAGGAHDEASALRAKLASAWAAVHAEKLGQLADEFDGVHSIERAREVGSVHAIVPAARLRPYLIDAVQRGMRRTRVRTVAGNARSPARHDHVSKDAENDTLRPMIKGWASSFGSGWSVSRCRTAGRGWVTRAGSRAMGYRRC